MVGPDGAKVVAGLGSGQRGRSLLLAGTRLAARGRSLSLAGTRLAARGRSLSLAGTLAALAGTAAAGRDGSAGALPAPPGASPRAQASVPGERSEPSPIGSARTAPASGRGRHLYLSQHLPYLLRLVRGRRRNAGGRSW